MATTTNYSWTTPDDTDLVKDGAAAIRTLGSAIDTTTKNLNPQTTTGAIAYRSSTNNVNTSLPIGTAGQVLKVNSGATAPEWGSVSAESLTLINTGGTTLTGASVSITSIPQTYKNLYILVVNFKSDPVDNRSLFMRFNGDSGANRHNSQQGDTDVNDGAFDATFSVIGSSADATDAQGIIAGTLYDYTNTTTWKLYWGVSVTNNGTTSTNYNYGIRAGIYNQTSAITSLTFLTTATYSLNGGTVYLYGVK